MIVQADVETELLRVWNLISELSDQLQENRDVTADLRAQAEALKVEQPQRIISIFLPCYRQKLFIQALDILLDGSTWICQKVNVSSFHFDAHTSRSSSREI